MSTETATIDKFLDPLDSEPDHALLEPCRQKILNDPFLRRDVKKLLAQRAKKKQWRYLFCAFAPAIIILLVFPVLVHKFPGENSKRMIRSEINLITWIFVLMWMGCQYLVYRVMRCETHCSEKDIDNFIMYDREAGKNALGSLTDRMIRQTKTWMLFTNWVVFFCMGMFIIDAFNGIAPSRCFYNNLKWFFVATPQFQMNEDALRAQNSRQRLLESHPFLKISVKKLVKCEHELKTTRLFFLFAMTFIPFILFDDSNFYPVLHELARKDYIPEIPKYPYSLIQNLIFGAPLLYLLALIGGSLYKYNPDDDMVKYMRNRFIDEDQIQEDMKTAKFQAERLAFRAVCLACMGCGMLWAGMSNYLWPGPIYATQKFSGNLTTMKGINGFF